MTELQLNVIEPAKRDRASRQTGSALAKRDGATPNVTELDKLGAGARQTRWSKHAKQDRDG